MQLPRPGLLPSTLLVISVVADTVFRFEIERFWSGHVAPFLGANAARVVESMSGFSGGVIITLALLFIADHAVRYFKRKRMSPNVAPPQVETAVCQNTKPRPADDVNKSEGMVRVDGNDFDIVPMGMILRGTLSDDGVDVVAILQYRNRSKAPVALKPILADFVIDGRRSTSRGISTPIQRETTNTIQFLPIRIYNKDDPRGSAEFRLAFGMTSSSMRTILVMRYDFQLRSYPPNKSTDAVLQADIREQVYYERRADGMPLV